VPSVPLGEQLAGVGDVLVGERADLVAGHAVIVGHRDGFGVVVFPGAPHEP
jgi:hypothetical protein